MMHESQRQDSSPARFSGVGISNIMQVRRVDGVPSHSGFDLALENKSVYIYKHIYVLSSIINNIKEGPCSC